MKVLIFGANGQDGYYLSEDCRKRQIEVIGILRSGPWLCGDVPFPEIVEKLIRSIHLLTREYEIAKIEEAKSMPMIQVLDKAVVPEKKSKPKRRQMVLLAGVTSLFVSILAAFVHEHLTRTSLGGMKD